MTLLPQTQLDNSSEIGKILLVVVREMSSVICIVNVNILRVFRICIYYTCDNSNRVNVFKVYIYYYLLYLFHAESCFEVSLTVG